MKKNNNKVTTSTISYLVAGFIFIIIVSSLYLLYINSGFKNHGKAMGAIGIPMTKNIIKFFKVHQRYPTQMESENLFIKSGCNNIKRSINKYDCTQYSKIHIYLLSADLNEALIPNTKEYSLSVKYKNTRCRSYFDKNGKIVINFKCEQLPFIKNKLFGSH